MNNTQNGGHKTAPAPPDANPFPDEIAHLNIIGERLEAALRQADATVNQIDTHYRGTKRYMVDNRGELDPHEMFQNVLELAQIDKTGALAVNAREKLAKLKDSPYFARIDFQAEQAPDTEPHYIGRFAFSHKDELLILDWRAPLASMFYDCEVGPAAYDAPVGKIAGRLTRKRQFKVKNGALEYALESSVNIQDDVLQRELSHTSDEKMKSIISTIQKEQNKIIRSEKAETMMLQGVAGSGKTSIALHRIAFLLYRYRESLSARNVIILSPNRVFGDYISTVLPELGEEPIREMSFAELAELQLEGSLDFEPERDPLETADEAWAQRVRFKSTLEFLRLLERYLQELPTLLFEPVDYTFGRFTARADWLRKCFFAYHMPIKKRLERIAEDLFDRFQAIRLRGEDTPSEKSILKSLSAMLTHKTSLALYRHFYAWLGHPELLVLPQKQTLEWADVFPFLSLRAAFEGLPESRMIKHLVIDEMQDYTPVQYAVINHLFPCPKTILGDFGQRLNPNHRHTLADLQALYKTVHLVELYRSYRSTYEIITFAKRIQPLGRLEPMERHGEAPQLILCKDPQDQLAQLKIRLDAFLQGAGGSLGIILKTNSAARAFYKLLLPGYALQLISPESTRFASGISVTSVQMAKGLEFDEVLLPDASDVTYCTEYDRGLLYVAATRAMHRLALFFVGTPSRFLPVCK